MTVNSSYSVVIIARNEEAHIRKTVESILNQNVKPYRVVVVDDGSTDATPAILTEMHVDVKCLPPRDDQDRAHKDTLHDVRNVGLEMVRDDPVKWVYSGDADIVLPSRYCETIMRRSGECGAYIGAGTEKGVLDYLPMDGFRMIRHDWLRSEGMHTKWESIYLCIKALAAGHCTMVRHADDCVVASQRPTGSKNPSARAYGEGRLLRRMGAPAPYVCWRIGAVAKARGPVMGLMCLRGWCGAALEVSEEMQRAYRMLMQDYLTVRLFGRFGRRHRMITTRDDETICRWKS